MPTGRPPRKRPVAPGQLSAEALDAALAVEKSRRLQIPPAVSAIKVDGRRSYALTRAGNAPELAAREVQVEELQLLAHSEH